MERQASLHPADETLVSYGLGKLDDTVAESVNKHLEQCVPCRRRVAELSSDSFLGRLREAQPQAADVPPADLPTRPKTLVEPDPPRKPLPEADKHAATTPFPPISDDQLLPELVNHPQYEVVRELGRGGMGVVYLARNKLMDRLEVLKVMNKETLAKQGTADRFLREIQSAAKLQHPNVVAAYTALQMGNLLVFAMEYVDGEDLAKLVRARGPLPVINACYFAYQAAQGLQHAHERGMIHRDIKPGNLILFRQGKKGIVKILDFGLAKVTSEQGLDRTLTQQGQMLGTPDYIAPEQTLDAQKADIRADIYSLGCTLYHLLTGHPPFAGNSLYEVLQAHHSVDAKPLNLVRPEVPVELAAVVSKMMAKEPKRRYQTPAEVVQVLKPFLKPGGLSSPQPELSQVASQYDRPAAAAGSAPTPDDEDSHPLLAPMDAARPAERWKSLVDTPQLDRSSAVGSAVRKRVRRQPPWMWPSLAIGAVLFGLLAAWAGGVFSVKTTDGVIVLEDLPENAEVLVDGEVVTVRPIGDKSGEFTVRAGDHRVEVKKGDVCVIDEKVSIASGQKEPIRIHLEQLRKTNSEAPSLKVADSAPVTPAEVPPDSKTGASRPAADRRATEVVGDWQIRDGELVKPTQGEDAEIRFGDPSWTDYDFSVELLREHGNRGCWLQYRCADPKNRYGFLPAVRNKACAFVEWHNGVERPPVHKGPFHLENGRWYNAVVKVRGDRIEVSVDGKILFDHVDGRLPTGGVGLGAHTTVYRFRNIKVTAPDGAVLWSGLPDLDSSAKSDGPAVSLAEPHVVVQASPSSGSKDVFVPLFNGKDLSGWHVESEGSWTVQDGILIAKGSRQIGKPMRLVADQKSYRNFKLVLKILNEDSASFHAIIRFSSSDDHHDGYRIAMVDEVTSDGAALHRGSILRAERFGFGDPNLWKASAQPTNVAPGEWYTVEIKAIGNRVSTAVNGAVVADYEDPGTPFAEGGIVLAGRNDAIAHIKEIKIKELPSNETSPSGEDISNDKSEKPAGAPSSAKNNDGFVPLFNGQDLNGWTDEGGGAKWTTEGGRIVARAQKAKAPSFLLTTRDYSNFRLQLEFIAEKESWGMIALRAIPGETLGAANIQHPALILSAPGELETGTVRWLRGETAIKPDQPAEMKPAGLWNRMEITVNGHSIRASLNGKEIVNAAVNDDVRLSAGTLPGLNRIKGRVGLGHGKGTIRFREIMIAELPESAADDSHAKADAAPINVEDRINKAKADFDDAMKRANTKLTSQFDLQIRAHRAKQAKSGIELALVEALQQEKDAWMTKGLIPWSYPMRSALHAYAKSAYLAHNDLDRAYLLAIDQATKAHDDATASKLRTEKAIAGGPHAVAIWKFVGHKVRWSCTLYSNGRVNNPQSPSVWSLEGPLLVLRMVNPKSPSGFFLDSCALTPNGRACNGHNQHRGKFTGTLVEE